MTSRYVENRDAFEIVAALHNASSRSRCPLGIVDTIVFDRDGAPLKWLFTGKTGEIVKKKAIQDSVVKDRFRRVALMSPANEKEWMCILRYTDASFEIMDSTAFGTMMTTFPPKETGVAAVQAYVQSKGTQGTFYRNKYSVVNDKGKVVSSTHSYATLPKEISVLTGKVRLKNKDLEMTKSNANRLNQALDAATRTLVRFVESSQHVRVLEISVDYIVDEDSQLWVAWVSDARVAVGQAALDLRLAGLQLEDNTARTTWLGGEVAKEMHKQTSMNETRHGKFRSKREDEGGRRDHATVEKMVESAAEVVEAKPRERKYGEKQPTQTDVPGYMIEEDRKVMGIAAVSDEDGQYMPPAPPKKSDFPTPYACQGDFCNMELAQPKSLQSDNLALAQKLFSSDRLAALRKTNRFDQLLRSVHRGDPLQYAELPFKSIALARKDGQGDLSKGTEPPGQPKTRGGILKQTEASAIRDNWRADRGDLEGGTANYYQAVKVCGKCFHVYSLLDSARNLLERDQQEVQQFQRMDEQSDRILEHPSQTTGARPRKSKKGQPLIMTEFVQKRKEEPKKKKLEPLSTWKNHVEKAQNNPKNSQHFQRFEAMDGYLRNAEMGELPPGLDQSVAGTMMSEITAPTMADPFKDGLYHATVLIAEAEEEIASHVKMVLEAQGYMVSVESDGQLVLDMLLAVNVEEGVGGIAQCPFDAVLLDRDLPVADAFEITRQVREAERALKAKATKRARMDQTSIENLPPPLPVICFTNKANPEDLRSYMEVGMDGCISKPADELSLINTLKAAVPHHLTKPTKEGEEFEEVEGKVLPAVRNAKKKIGATTEGILGALEGGSSAIAASGMALPQSFTVQDGSISGVVRIDPHTAVPYTVMDAATSQKRQKTQGSQFFFNLVVCHDFFETLERVKIFLRPITNNYPGMQVLLWNYPGQAFTEFREDQVLNNEYLASCLHQVMMHVGPGGSRQFDTTRPFYLMGFGNGANIAAFYATHYSMPSLRALLSFNGFLHVDEKLAGTLHDCVNVFSCTPASRPDLPVYFYSRFLFSTGYLAQVSTPLALNLYTAVHCPISIEGRIQLAVGALSHIDLRPLLQELEIPVIAVHSTQDQLVRPSNAEDFMQGRMPARSIHNALTATQKTCVVWVKSGHELFQECRAQISLLIEQLVTGYHEANDAGLAGQGMATKFEQIADGQEEPVGALANGVEDHFIDNVLTTLTKAKEKEGEGQQPEFEEASLTSLDKMNARMNDEGIEASKKQWEAWQTRAGTELSPGVGGAGKPAKKKKKNPTKGKQHQIPGDSQSMFTVLDPSKPAFERQDNAVYGMGEGSKIYPNPDQFPEIKEYMGWRLKRNQKRLQRLDKAARQVQSAFRGFLAWRLAQRLREQRAALYIQRVYRGWKGRLRFLERIRMLWAAQLLQRNYRGHMSRKRFLELRRKHAAAQHMQRVWRGRNARNIVMELIRRRNYAATLLQAQHRGNKAREYVMILRIRRDAAIEIQRMYRGHVGRMKAKREEEKYIFSQSQSQGIEFGRQMLLEHRLHAARLQSEIALLSQEKASSEESIESLLQEISEFEEGVATLEKEMHQLSKVETEAMGVLDEEARFELREQKIRLDREFGEMLEKIGERKEKLQGFEKKLASLDRARGEKEEELRSLERKLVVLLEEQQKELQGIRKRQEKRAITNGKTPLLTDGNGNFAEGAGGAMLPIAEGEEGIAQAIVQHMGPSQQEKKQAANLMQSTETLMKFGFMSMSMTYFSSLNMIRAMRTVGATDTVMAAMQEKQMRQQLAEQAGDSGGGLDVGLEHERNAKFSKEPFRPSLKPGQMPGQEPIKVSAWTVQDVARWLQTLKLSQYQEAFIDAAIDGEFLYDLNDDDLKNTLGVEHRLHRKKILNFVERLKRAEYEHDQHLQMSIAQKATGPSMVHSYMDPGLDAENPGAVRQPPPGSMATGGDPGSVAPDENSVAANLDIKDIIGWVRHGKYKKIQDAVDPLQNRKFDPSLVRVPYVEDFGTAYVDAYEREIFNLNKTDDFGNTPLLVAAQNGNRKIASLLIQKGANPNHQNQQGQTAGHYALAYQFFDFSSWLFDSTGGGADDTIENKFGLGVYDGLHLEVGGEQQEEYPAITDGYE